MSRLPDEDAIAHEFHRSGNLDDGSQMDYREVGPGDNEGPVMDELDDLNLTEIMKIARKAAMINLTRLVRAGQATPADMSVLAKLLKDNGMVMGDPFEKTRGETPGAQDEEEEALPLPTFGKPEYDE